MILAHLPSGYLVGRALGVRRGPVMAAALIGSVFPDADMIWFYLVDEGRIHHHRYWVHAPGFWLGIAVLVLPVIGWRWTQARPAALAFFAAIAVHLVLDSVGGGIMWTWPLSTRLYSLIEVPANHGHWVISFLLHWSMLAELAILAAAGWIFLKHRTE